MLTEDVQCLGQHCMQVYCKRTLRYFQKFLVPLLALIFYFNLHFFVIDLVENLKSKFRQLKKQREKKKAKKYEELPINRDTEAGVSHNQDVLNSNQEESGLSDEQERKDAEASRKINSIFDDEDDDDEEENPIPF